MNRRSAIAGLFSGAFASAEAIAQSKGNNAPVTPRENLKITKLETFLVKPRWLFLKVHTNAGIVGLGEPIVEGRALTCAEAVKEIEPYLVGKDPRQVVHHWQAIYRHAFYRGGPILTSALSGIDKALWDIKGKALGVPVYELLGGPTRNRVRVYCPCRDAGDDEVGHGARLHRVQDRAREAPARALRRDAGRGAIRGRAVRRAAAGGRRRRRHRHRLPRRHQPGDRQAADQGPRAVPADVHRGALPGPEPRHHGRDRARHAPADRHRRARLHQVGLPRGAGEAGRDDPPARPVPRRRHHRGAA